MSLSTREPWSYLMGLGHHLNLVALLAQQGQQTVRAVEVQGSHHHETVFLRHGQQLGQPVMVTLLDKTPLHILLQGR